MTPNKPIGTAKVELPELMAKIDDENDPSKPKYGYCVTSVVEAELTKEAALEVIARCNAAPKLAEGLKTYGEHLYKCPCLPSNGQAELEDCTCGLTAILKETKGEG